MTWHRVIVAFASLCVLGSLGGCAGLGDPCGGDDGAECGSGLRCGAGVCIRSNGQLLGEMCTGPECASGLLCSSAGVCVQAQVCASDAECAGGMSCSGADIQGHRLCGQACTAQSGCQGGYVCHLDAGSSTGTSCDSRLAEACYTTDPSTRTGACGIHGACSAATRRCVGLVACASAETCGGYACVSGLCGVSCTTDVDCGPGDACDTATFSCVSRRGATCDPGSDLPMQCGSGLACAPASQTCVTASTCTTNADCGGYACNALGYCLQTCTADVLPCQVGHTCDATTHQCS